jgi:hypothetical protein
MEVRSFKLTTGEEIIAEFIQATSTGYEIKHPLVVVMMKTPDGDRMGFAEWSMIMNQDQKIHLNDTGLVARPLTVVDAVSQSYQQQFSSIILPPVQAGKILHD